jgi:type I restriction enzyme M protein
MSDANGLVQRLWNYCNVLRDDGLSYQDYIEQLTFLLFLKMADEQTKPPFNRPSIVPPNLDWASILKRDGDDLEVQYRHVLEGLGKAQARSASSSAKRRTRFKIRPSCVGLSSS